MDSRNGKRHDYGTKQGLSIEETWRTNRWPRCVFSFILALTEVNAFNAMKYFGSYQGTEWEFCKKLVYQMIHNACDVDTKKRGKNKDEICDQVPITSSCPLRHFQNLLAQNGHASTE